MRNSIIQIINILAKPYKPWPSVQDISFSTLLIVFIFPLVILNVVSAFLSLESIKKLSIISAVLTPILNIAFATLALHVFSSAFKGKKSFNAAYFIALIANIPFLIILAFSYHLESQFVWLGLLFSICLAWFGLGFLFKIPTDRRIPFLLISLLTFGLFWIIFIFFIQILIP
jgi:hypothetical protein